SSPLYVGNGDGGLSTGAMDETLVYHRALTAAERLLLFNDGDGRTYLPQSARLLAPTGSEWRAFEYEVLIPPVPAASGPRTYTIPPTYLSDGINSLAEGTISGYFTFDPDTSEFSEPFEITITVITTPPSS